VGGRRDAAAFRRRRVRTFTDGTGVVASVDGLDVSGRSCAPLGALIAIVVVPAHAGQTPRRVLPSIVLRAVVFSRTRDPRVR